MALLRYVFDSLTEHKEKNKIIIRISEFNELIGNLVQKERRTVHIRTIWYTL